jgi:hypothetical protein
MAKEKKDDQLDRRSKRRSTIEQGVRYRLIYGSRVTESGAGRTANISSNGIWFTTDRVLGSGLLVELSMSWPILLNDVCPMKLMIYGCIVRSGPAGAALSIERYEFRTQSMAGIQPYDEASVRLPT